MTLLLLDETLAPSQPATPAVAPPGAVPPGAALHVDVRRSLVQWLAAPDGTIWPITGLGSAVRLMTGGLRGLGPPETARRTVVSPTRAGSRWRSARTIERPVLLPLAVYAEPGQAWYDMAAALWRLLSPDRTVRWSVQQPSGQVRWLDVRYTDGGGAPFDADPGPIGWSRYAVELVAEQPYWQSAPVERAWQDDPDPPPTFPSSPADGYVLALTSGHTLGQATVSNPGDVDSYPTWTCTGPFRSCTVGVGDALIEMPFPVAAGRTVTVDTDPAVLSAWLDDGTDVTARLGRAEFAPVPAGRDRQLTLTMVADGTGGRVQVSLPVLWRTALG